MRACPYLGREILWEIIPTRQPDVAKMVHAHSVPALLRVLVAMIVLPLVPARVLHGHSV